MVLNSFEELIALSDQLHLEAKLFVGSRFKQLFLSSVSKKKKPQPTNKQKRNRKHPCPLINYPLYYTPRVKDE